MMLTQSSNHNIGRMGLSHRPMKVLAYPGYDVPDLFEIFDSD